jgi:hypothetical protein
VSSEHDCVVSSFPIDVREFQTSERPVLVNARREGKVVG